MAPRRFVAARAELVDAGFSPSRIDCWLRSGRLVKVARGVYSYGRDVENREAAWRAALAAVGPGSVLAGRSACEAWEMVRKYNSVPLWVEVAGRSGSTRVLRGTSPALSRTRISVVKRQLNPSDIRQREGLPLVGPVLALLDLASGASERQVRFAFLEACRLGLIGQPDVRDFYEQLSGRRGIRKIKPLLGLWVPELERIKSVLEGLILLGIVDRPLPIPRVNKGLCGYEVDFFWPESGVVLEADGGAFHSDPPQRAIDLAKQRDLERHGLCVLRTTFKDYERNPKGVLDEIASTLASRTRAES